MRILITGAAGFVGPYLAQHLRSMVPKAEIWGLVWSDDERSAPEFVTPIPGDLTDRPSLSRAIETARPEIVFHLAGASSVASSWDNPDLFLKVNLEGSINLFEAIRDSGCDSRIVLASSAEIYGSVPLAEQPIVENTPLQPLSPYGKSKAAQDLAALQYFQEFGLQTIRLRLFHHTGPARPPFFVASSFARQIARIEQGLDPPTLSVGNLDAVRDFSDVRDVARAYWLVADRGEAGAAYNVCSSRGRSMGQLLDMMLAMTASKVEISIDPDRLRAADIPHLVGDHTRLSTATGWQPEIAFEQTLEDLLDWWRAELRNHRID